MTSSKKEYLIYLQDLRNDFYNRGNKEVADKVQKDIDVLCGEIFNNKN